MTQDQNQGTFKAIKLGSIYANIIQQPYIFEQYKWLDIVEHIYIYYIPDGLIFPKWFDICEDKFIKFNDQIYMLSAVIL